MTTDRMDDWFKLLLGAIWKQAIAQNNLDPDLCRHMASADKYIDILN